MKATRFSVYSTVALLSNLVGIAHAQVLTPNEALPTLIGDAAFGVARGQENQSWPTVSASIGLQQAWFQTAATMVLSTDLIMNSVEFYGAYAGPVIDINQYRLALSVGGGWQRYDLGGCRATGCVVPGADDGAFAFLGKLGVGRSFETGHHDHRIVVMGWLMGTYAAEHHSQVVTTEGNSWALDTGGFRPGGLLSIGAEMPF